MSTARLLSRGLKPAFQIQRQAQRVARRQIHAESPDHHIPVPFDSDNKRAFALKAFAYMGTGFAIPFIAVWWNWNKPGGIHNTGTA